VIYLLDVSVILPLLLTGHVDHAKAFTWAQGKDLAVCPITEIGFLRVSTQPRGLNVVMSDAEQLLQTFHRDKKPRFVPDDFSAQALGAKSPAAVTDTYLSELAQRHSMRLATFDGGIAHPAAELIS
jgi:predicted nucleic acid-binding protein